MLISNRGILSTKFLSHVSSIKTIVCNPVSGVRDLIYSLVLHENLVKKKRKKKELSTS